MFEELASKFGTFCCGTLRKNRKELPQNLMVDKHVGLQERGQAIFSKCLNLILYCWRDRKIIRLLSTIHGTTLSTCERSMKDRETAKFARKEISCPVAVRDYSKFMGGVDLADQLYSYYCFGKKSRKWTKKIFFYVLELMVLNSYILYNSTRAKKISLYEFTVTLVDQIVTDGKGETPPRAAPVNIPDRLNSRCMPADLGRKAYCKVCAKRASAGGEGHRKSQTRYGCATCAVHLCLPHCFTRYHTVDRYEVLPVHLQPARIVEVEEE